MQLPKRSEDGKKRERKAVLLTLVHDDITGEYYMDERKVPESEIPKEALPVSGKGRRYLLSSLGPGDVPDPRVVTALDLNLYMVNNDINDALSVHFSSFLRGLDIRTIIIGLIVLAVGVCIIWAMLPSLT